MTEQSIRLSRNENGNRGWFRRAGTLVATGGIVLGSLVLTASGASAESNKPIKESTIKSECKSAGGTYGSKTVEGTNFSACHYKDNEGNGFSDFYLNGSYYSTDPGDRRSPTNAADPSGAGAATECRREPERPGWRARAGLARLRAARQLVRHAVVGGIGADDIAHLHESVAKVVPIVFMECRNDSRVILATDAAS